MNANAYWTKENREGEKKRDESSRIRFLLDLRYFSAPRYIPSGIGINGWKSLNSSSETIGILLLQGSYPSVGSGRGWLELLQETRNVEELAFSVFVGIGRRCGTLGPQWLLTRLCVEDRGPIGGTCRGASGPHCGVQWASLSGLLAPLNA